MVRQAEVGCIVLLRGQDTLYEVSGMLAIAHHRRPYRAFVIPNIFGSLSCLKANLQQARPSCLVFVMICNNSLSAITTATCRSRKIHIHPMRAQHLWILVVSQDEVKRAVSIGVLITPEQAPLLRFVQQDVVDDQFQGDWGQATHRSRMPGQTIAKYWVGW